MPQCVHVGLALDEHHIPCGLGIAEPVQAVEAGLAAGFPAEAVAVQGNTEAHGQFFATRPEVRNAHRRPAGQDHVGQPALSHEINRQGRNRRVLFERQAERLRGCMVVNHGCP